MAATWTTKEGQTVPISDMSDSHILNTIKMLRRHALKMWNSIAYTANPFGDDTMAEFDFDSKQEAMWEEGFYDAYATGEKLVDEYGGLIHCDVTAHCDKYPALCEEAIRRRLDFKEREGQ